MATDGGTRRSSRAALVDAALEEFSAKGYEAATLAGIAERAGVTTGAVYAHFAGKLDLLIQAVGLTPADELERLVASNQPASREEAVALFAEHLAAGPDPGALLLLDAVVAGRRDPVLAALLRAGLEAYLDVPARTAAGGGAVGLVAPALGPDDLARVIGLLSLGAVVFEALGERLPTPDAYARLAALLLQSPTGSDDPMGRVRDAAAEAAAAKSALDDALAAAVAAGHSLREVGAAAGLSHERVRAARDR